MLRKQPPFTMLAVMPVLEFGSLPRRKTEDASAVNVLHPLTRNSTSAQVGSLWVSRSCNRRYGLDNQIAVLSIAPC